MTPAGRMHTGTGDMPALFIILSIALCLCKINSAVGAKRGLKDGINCLPVRRQRPRLQQSTRFRDLYISENSGTGTIQTEHFPDVAEPEYTKIKTGEKGLFGLERKQKVQSGNKVDPLFAEMVKNYYDAYSHFYGLLCERDTEATK